MLSDATRKRLFETLEVCNHRLEVLFPISDDSPASQSRWDAISRKSATSLRSWDDLWNHAGRLYHALFGSWGCTCRANHTVRLFLQHPTSNEPEFNLSLY